MNLKKLLASIGLLAISAPTTLSLVACNDYNENKDESSHPLTEYLTEEKLDLGLVLNTEEETAVQEAINKMNKIIEGIEEIKDKVDLADPKDGKIHVTVKDEFKNKLTGEADFLYKIVDAEEYIVNLLNNRYAYFWCSANVTTKDQVVKAINENSSTNENTKFDFIKTNLNSKSYPVFNPDFCTVNNITYKSGKEIKGEEIIAKDENPIEATINYTYGKFENKKLNFIIFPRKAAPISEDRQELLNKINNATPDETQAYKHLWLAYINQFFKDVNTQKLKVQIHSKDLSLLMPPTSRADNPAAYRIYKTSNYQISTQLVNEVNQIVQNLDHVRASFKGVTFGIIKENNYLTFERKTNFTVEFAPKDDKKDNKKIEISLLLQKTIKIYWNLVDKI